MEHYIKQNNIFSIYEEYFTDAPEVTKLEPNPLRTLEYLKDPFSSRRAVTAISWSPEGGTRLAAAYSHPFWEKLFEEKDNESYIWNIGINRNRNTANYIQILIIAHYYSYFLFFELPVFELSFNHNSYNLKACAISV